MSFSMKGTSRYQAMNFPRLANFESHFAFSPVECRYIANMIHWIVKKVQFARNIVELYKSMFYN